MSERIIEIPDGVDLKLEGRELVVKSGSNELRRRFYNYHVKMEIKDGKVLIKTEEERRKVKAVLGTWNAHVNNMINGVTKGYEAKLKIVYSHFPIKFVVKGEIVVISNFLGEKKPRTSYIIPGTEVKMDKDEVVVKGIDKEKVGQTAANIETTCKIKELDRRVFQDGCFITQKPTIIESN
ncbi:MAG: 50S ribosomal protein L6 [Candidatus Aenigmatarchaeota archaeon]